MRVGSLSTLPKEVTAVAKEKGARKANDKKPAQKTLKEKRQDKKNKAK